LHHFGQVTFDVQREPDRAVEQFGSAVIGGPAPLAQLKKIVLQPEDLHAGWKGAGFPGRCQ